MSKANAQKRKERIPSDSEWLVMEVLWDSKKPLSSAEIIRQLSERAEMTPRMVRVLLNRLCQKELVTYVIDEKDARVYHYSFIKGREECRKEKGKQFVECYFAGNQTGAIASLMQGMAFTKEQMRELEEILEKNKQKGEV